MLGIKEIFQKDINHFGIKWSDDQEQTFNVVHLRKNCPCASCVDEFTGKRFENLNISEDVKPKTIRNVGRYAITVEFDDSHNTGIYSFKLLRKLGTPHLN